MHDSGLRTRLLPSRGKLPELKVLQRGDCPPRGAMGMDAGLKTLPDAWEWIHFLE
jgi:hypothetical protein